MEHQQIEEQLTAYLLGDLAPEQAEAMRRHLDECDDCRALAKELEPTLDLLRGALAVDAGVPARLDDDRKEEIFAPRHVPVTVIWLSEHRSALMRVAGVAAVAVVLFALMMPSVQLAKVSSHKMTDKFGRLDRQIEELETPSRPAAPKPMTRGFAEEDVYSESAPTSEETPVIGQLFKSNERAPEPVVPMDAPFGNLSDADVERYVSLDDAMQTFDGDSSVRYQVKKGDTLTAIAAANETTVRELAELNKLENPNAIQVGGSLVIPVSEPESEHLLWSDVSGPQPSAEPTGGAGIAGGRLGGVAREPVRARERLDVAGETDHDLLAVTDDISALGFGVESAPENQGVPVRRQIELSRGKVVSGKDLGDDFFASSGEAPVTTAPILPELVALNGSPAVDSDVDGIHAHWGGGFSDGRDAKGLSVAESRLRPTVRPSAGVEIGEAVHGKAARPAPAPDNVPEYVDGYALTAGMNEEAESSMESDFAATSPETAPVGESTSSLDIIRVAGLTSDRLESNVAAKQEIEGLGELSAELGKGREFAAKVLSQEAVDSLKQIEDRRYAKAGDTLERDVAPLAPQSGGRANSSERSRKPADLADTPAEPEIDTESELVARAYGVNPFVSAAEQPFSTFAIDVDTASYTLMRKHVQNGVLPPAEAVRTEEVVNFFDYDYRAPERQTFAVYTSLAPTPFGDGRLLQIGVKGKRLGREEQRPAVLTFVIDTSGSMDTPDRLGLVRQSLNLLIDELGEADQVAIVQVDSQARLILPPTALAERDAIASAIEGLQCSGSTHLEDGIKLGYEVAAQAFTGGSVNRVLLLSDGAANLGSANAEQILSMVEAQRRQGIFCSVFGFGIGAYNDEILEQLANKGDGSYRFIDSQEEAKRVFVDELAATLHVIASDVKIQVEFFPEQVKTYRQLGYENRQLTKEQFRDDTVDAGEVGSGESVTALYELVAGTNVDQPLGVVRVRYRDAATGEIDEIAHPIRMSDAVASFEEASPQFRLAAAVAEFAEILRGSPFADGADYAAVADVLRPVALDLRLDQRVQELLQLVQRAPGLPRAGGN